MLLQSGRTERGVSGRGNRWRSNCAFYRTIGFVLTSSVCLSHAVDAGTVDSDSCTDSVPLVGTGTFAFDNTLATQDGPTHAACTEFDQPEIDHDVWFCWTADCTGDVTVETCDQTSVDTKIAAYDGCTCPPSDAALLDCADSGCSLQSSVSFSAVSGNSYLVRVGTAPNASGGSGSFAVDCSPIDECAEGTDNCDVNASCSDTVDGWVCTCKGEGQGGGVTCT